MTDAELVARVLEGEGEAFSVLVDRYYEPCGRYAQRLLGNREDAEDALQEAFLRAYRALARYHERDAFKGWLFRIVVNQCRTVSLRRRRHGQRFVTDDEAVGRHPVAGAEDGIVLSDALQTSLEAIDPLQREAFLLKYGEGFEYREMAQMTGASVSALKMRVKRACETLRPRLEETRR